jgi:hypothetical protein
MVIVETQLGVYLYFGLQRGGVLIQKWGRSSAASTAVSIADAMKSLVTPTPEGDWFSSGVSSCWVGCRAYVFPFVLLLFMQVKNQAAISEASYSYRLSFILLHTENTRNRILDAI